MSRREQSRGPEVRSEPFPDRCFLWLLWGGGGGDHENNVASVGPFEIPCTHGVLRQRCARLAHTLSTILPALIQPIEPGLSFVRPDEGDRISPVQLYKTIVQDGPR
jgi:hypothetical protein